MSAADSWMRLLIFTGASLIGVMFLNMAFFFAPGWANGWPFGWRMSTVWSTGMAILFFMLVLTFAASLGAMVGYFCSERRMLLRYGLWLYFVWLIAAAVLARTTSLWIFDGLLEAARQMWPNR